VNNDENVCERTLLWMKRNGFMVIMLKQKIKNLSKNRKTTASSVKCEGDVHCVFLFVYGGVVHNEF